jgi:hypothetical protein
VSQEDLDRLVESLEAPWGARIERIIRETVESAAGPDGSIALVEKIKLLGLEPYRPPDPLPPIIEEEIILICWMGISKAT